MTRPMLNIAAPVLGMAVLGGLLGLCWKDARWFFLMAPLLVGFSYFASNYGSKGMDAKNAAMGALNVSVLVGIISALIFVFTVMPTL